VIKKTVSADTSDWIKSYCEQVVVGDHGTGKTARPAGYMIGGKTGTAETLPRKNGQYVVSFMGYAPADNPQIVCYVVVDRPNASPQDNARFATGIFRNILTEVLPYLNIPMTEPLSDDEKAELQQLQESGTIALGANAMAALDSPRIRRQGNLPLTEARRIPQTAAIRHLRQRRPGMAAVQVHRAMRHPVKVHWKAGIIPEG
jgi:stage V sporulation protein D (sporulation-specific penicillin-binding protein)